MIDEHMSEISDHPGPSSCQCERWTIQLALGPSSAEDPRVFSIEKAADQPEQVPMTFFAPTTARISSLLNRS
jgi:hypothetical protein